MVRRANPAVSAAKSAELETQAQAWIEGVTGEVFEGEFGEELRDGRRLCNLINAIKPGSVRRVNDSRMPFKQMENVSNFLKACRAVGVPEYSLFETVDLFELKDVGLVVMCLVRTGWCRHSHTVRCSISRKTRRNLESRLTFFLYKVREQRFP